MERESDDKGVSRTHASGSRLLPWSCAHASLLQSSHPETAGEVEANIVTGTGFPFEGCKQDQKISLYRSVGVLPPEAREAREVGPSIRAHCFLQHALLSPSLLSPSLLSCSAELYSIQDTDTGSRFCMQVFVRNQQECRVNNNWPNNKTHCCEVGFNKFKFYPSESSSSGPELVMPCAPPSLMLLPL